MRRYSEEEADNSHSEYGFAGDPEKPWQALARNIVVDSYQYRDSFIPRSEWPLHRSLYKMDVAMSARYGKQK